MLKLLEYLKEALFGAGEQARSPQDVEQLRTAFRARYHSFKLLLAANQKALETMSDMERALVGARPFGMTYVKAACTAVSVNAMKIIRHLTELAPGRYEELNARFKAIQEAIGAVLASRKPAAGDRLVVPLEEVDKSTVAETGSKMANLGEVLKEMNLPVPGGFVVTALGYQRFIEHNDLQVEIDRRLQSFTGDKVDDLHGLSAEIQQLITRASVPEDLARAIQLTHARLERALGAGVRVSLRSSASGEDDAGVSFAGQYRSELNIGADHILEAYKEIVASKYSLHAMSYRFNRGIADDQVWMCVGCMAMVDAVAGGVMYSRNPIDDRDSSIVINAAWGLPKSVVDGSVTPDQFVVSRSDPMRLVEKTVRVKELKIVCDPEEGVVREALLEEESSSPSLTDEEALRLAGMAVRLEGHYGCPQDVEWVMARDHSFYVLQCRPLQQVACGLEPASVQDVDRPPIVGGGVTASPGAASGPVFFVRHNADVLQFPEGAVLVSAQPLPRWATVMNRAVAVVTEQGSVTGHLASVAREFGIPALFGVPRALERLTAGLVVTVDADRRRVHEGRLGQLLTATRRKNLMEGSPVHDILQRIARCIVPLNLLDPDAPEFRPGRCQTLHDITRFCHEKAVHEMFTFGKEHRFTERSSKQLVADVPMQLWVINLDDGFEREVEGRYVPLDNIRSIPMRAIWEGMVAIPWQGPPPVDAGGLMSVMFQATVNPALDPAMQSSFSNKNYFLISRNFCNLQSRFGFHFAAIEALVGERPGENYLSFQFKGGAADFSRRLARVVFVSEILGEFGFSVALSSDALCARVEDP
ncbi:MAG: pyruvate, water dikinase [Candidatus Riflebacteria bacterium]|nr:pyruvate, water dikinase [Candidatus Riflebacteria bacterium]